MADKLDNLLSQWKARRDLSTSAPDADGKHFLVFDGVHEVALSQLGNSVYLESDFGRIPSGRDAATDLLERLMKLQLAMARNSDDTLSVSADGETLTAFRVLRADRITLNEFDTALGAFVNAVALATQEIAAGRARAPQPGPVGAQVFIP